MSVLILKNASHEGPGTIEAFLKASDIPYSIVECSSEDIPSSSGFDTLVMMGGPMSVNDATDYPYISREIELALEFMKDNKKVLGVCLGAQIMAKALGSDVYPGEVKEIGWYDIELTGGGLSDNLMKLIATQPGSVEAVPSFPVFHWHGETFDIPEGATLLAKSGLFPNQAFRYGESSYAFQFHIEVTKDMIYDWLRDEPSIDINTVRAQTEVFFGDYSARAEVFYRAFFQNLL